MCRKIYSIYLSDDIIWIEEGEIQVKYTKILVGSLFLAWLGFQPISAHAATEVEHVSVFYKSEAGKELVLDQAENAKKLDAIDAVVGTFSKEEIKKLEASKQIEVVHTGTRKLRTQDVGLPVPFANFTTNWNQQLIAVQNAWQKGLDGQGVKVGIIDSGIANHTALPKVQHKTIISDSSQITYASSATSHGTFVAGIIAAQPGKAGNVIGVAPGVELYSYNIDGKDGADLIDFMTAINYAIQQKVNILNISMGISQADLLLPNEKVRDNPLYIAVKKALDAGVMVVAASGNDGKNQIDYPAAIPGVVAVGSVEKTKKLSYFSNTGSVLDLVAPGTDITSLAYSGGTSTGSGTSFSTPHVTGLLALLKQAYPKESAKQLENRLYANAIDLGVKGPDAIYGYGLAQFPSKILTASLQPVESAAAKYVRVNQSKIKTIVQKMNNKKTVHYVTEFIPLYTVTNQLTKAQKTSVEAYRKKVGATIISSTQKSSRIKATNYTTLKTKKASTWTWATPVKKSTVRTSAYAVYKDGAKVSGFTFSTSASGKYTKVKTTKTLAKGTYYMTLDPKNVRTTKNKTVKPVIVKYVVK